MWNSIFSTLPQDQQNIYVRILDVYSDPIEAIFELNGSTAEVYILATGLKVPFYFVARWMDRP